MPGFAISRGASAWLKGIAILLMLAHHLFGLPSLIEPPNAYVPLLPGMPLEYWIGRYGKICVGMFLLVSGYGLAVGGRGQNWRWFAVRAWRFLLAYWPYFMLAFTIGSLFFQERMANGNLRFPADPVGIALNALTLKNTMAFEWWFAETYLLLVLLTPLLLRVAGRRAALLVGSTLLFAAGSAMDLAKIDLPVVSLSNLLIWQLPWVIGMLLAGSLPEWLARLLASRPLAWLALAAMLTGFAVVQRFAGFAMTPFLIVASPVFAVALVTLTGQHERRGVVRWLGGYTLGLWLVHPFFCYYFFQSAIYAPRWSPLVFAALLLASLAVVLLVQGLRSIAARLLTRKSAA